MDKYEKIQWKILDALWVGLTVLLVISVPAFGASPGMTGEAETVETVESAYTAVDGNRISKERLEDGIVEYEELGSLIHYGNLSIQEMIDSMERTRQEYQEIRDYFRTERASANAKKKEAKEDHDMESYGEYASLEAVYSSAAKSYNERIRKLDRYAANKNRLSLEKQLTNAAQNLMLSWQSIKLQREYMEKMAELYQAVYENTKLGQSAGLATERDVTAAYQEWKDLEVSLSGIEDSEDAVCQNLYLLLGTDDGVSLANIPPVDTEQLSEINLEADIQKTIGNNGDLIAERDTKSAGTSSVNKKLRTLDELEEKVRIKMEQLYEEVNQKKQAYNAAKTGLDGADIQWKNTQSQYAMGMLSYVEYLQKQLQYVQKKMAFASADLALLQALENYHWAVKGIVTLD